MLPPFLLLSFILILLLLLPPSLAFLPPVLLCSSSSSTTTTTTSTSLDAGLSWRTDEIYHSQPDFPVLFLATRNETYAREVERHFGGQGYFVRSSRTLTRLAKMVKTTRPEGILISDHLSTSHILGFLANLRDLPDLWLIPIFIVHDLPSPTAATAAVGGSDGTAVDGEGSGKQEVDSSSSKSSRHRIRKKKSLQDDIIDADYTPPSLASSSSPLSQKDQEQRQQQWRQYHLEMLRLGVRGIITPSSPPLPELQALLDGAKVTRGRVENLVSTLQGGVLHLSQHQKRLLPSTITLEGPPPRFTNTEQEVLNLLSRGMTDQQIAYSLGCTSATVGNAVRGLLKKLEVDLRGELIRVAMDNDLLTE